MKTQLTAKEIEVIRDVLDGYRELTELFAREIYIDWDDHNKGIDEALAILEGLEAE